MAFTNMKMTLLQADIFKAKAMQWLADATQC
jgi:hypothetical protein